MVKICQSYLVIKKKEGDGDHTNCVDKSVVNNNYKKKEGLKNIKIGDVQLLNDECDDINGNAKKAIINGASVEELKGANKFKDVVKNLTEEELNGTPAYSALVKKVALLWSKDKLKNKHFNQDGNEDKTNVYIKANDKTAIESTETYRALKTMYDKVNKLNDALNEGVQAGDMVVVELSCCSQSFERYLKVESKYSGKEGNISITAIKSGKFFVKSGSDGTLSIKPGSIKLKNQKKSSNYKIDVKVKYVLKQDKK